MVAILAMERRANANNDESLQLRAMSTHKGSRSRIQDHDAAREAWERIWGKKDQKEKPLPLPPKPDKPKPC